MDAKQTRRVGKVPRPAHETIRYGHPGSVYMRVFGSYVRRFFRRNFHGVRLSIDGRPMAQEDRPLVIYLNHPSWWDPLLALVIGQRFFAGRRHLAFIDAEMAEKYRVLRPLGMVGIERGSAAGTRRFLRAGAEALADPSTVLWLTPHGRFVDPRDQEAKLAAGLGRLARLQPDADFLPLALEYPFWDERTPEALARFGAPFHPLACGLGPGALQATLERRLRETQAALAEDASSRDPLRFESLLDGRVGVGGPYDLWRRLRSAVHRTPFHAGHGPAPTKNTMAETAPRRRADRPAVAAVAKSIDEVVH